MKATLSGAAGITSYGTCWGRNLQRNTSCESSKHRDTARIKDSLDAPCLCVLCVSVVILERSAYGELEVVPRLMDTEWNAGHRPEIILVDTRRVERVIDAERRIQHGHDDLKLDAGAHTQTGVRTRQELSGKNLNLVRSNDLSIQFARLQHPRISDIHERNH